MKIHEYQGKEIFRKFGVPTPRGVPAKNLPKDYQVLVGAQMIYVF